MKIIIVFIITFVMNWPAHALARLTVELKNWLNSSVLDSKLSNNSVF